MEEVRFDRMVPSQIVARRKDCNLAYLPVGSLEWHGPHMPFGTDYFTVAYVAEESAKRFGGVAFPPIYYGDVRYILQECRVEWRNSYIKEMEVPEAYASAFPLENDDGSPGCGCPTRPDDGEPAEDPLPFSREEQEAAFVHTIARSMLSIHLYGFRNIILLPGHGPNPPYCRRAEETYAQNVRRRRSLGDPARTMTFFYIDPGKEIEPLLKNHWIHADKWEGSVTMVAAPGTVHPECLPTDKDDLVPAYLGTPYLTETNGYNPELKHLWHSFDALDPRNEMSEEYGRKQTEGILAHFGKVVQDFLSEPTRDL